MKIRNRKNYLTSLPEGTPPLVPRQRYTQWAYYSIILFTVASIIYLVIDYNIHYFGTGRIEVNKTFISSSRGGVIKELHVRAGQQLGSGDPIVTITADRHCSEEEDSSLEKLRYEIALKESRLRLLSGDLQTLKDADGQFIIRRALEIGEKGERLSESDREQRKLTQAIELLKNEIAIQRHRLNGAEKRASNTPLPSACSDELITTPFPSQVHLIKRNKSEYTGKGETVVILVANGALVHINAQFEQKSQRYLKKGGILEVELSDGWSTQGMISEIFSSSYEGDNEFINKSPDNYKVWARITPLDEASRQRWLDNDLMGINVRGMKL